MAASRRNVFAVLALLIVMGCKPSDPTARGPSQPVAQAAPLSTVPTERKPDGIPKRYSVVPYGYNYTDTYIDSFEVNGAGGGNLEVSIPTAGGGGHTCCMTLVSGLPLGTEFKIKWTPDRTRWCDQTVRLTNPVPIEPRYFEVHFYLDGHIESALQNSSQRSK